MWVAVARGGSRAGGRGFANTVSIAACIRCDNEMKPDQNKMLMSRTVLWIENLEGYTINHRRLIRGKGIRIKWWESQNPKLDGVARQ